MNNVSLIGRLTKDVELRYTSNGKAVANFTLAVNRPFQNQKGDYEADFIRTVVWGKSAENAANYLKKGSKAGVVGRIQTGSYEKNGQRFFTTDIVAEHVEFLDSKPNGQNGNQQRNNQNQNTNQGNPYQSNPFNNQPYGNSNGNSKGQSAPFDNGGPIDIGDEDLPF